MRHLLARVNHKVTLTKATERYRHYAIFLSAFKYTVKHFNTYTNPTEFLTTQSNEEDELKIGLEKRTS